jgi:hypothetical protein
MPGQLLKHSTAFVLQYLIHNTTERQNPHNTLPFSFDKADIEKSCPLTLSDTGYDAIHAFLMSPAQWSAGFNNRPFLRSNLLRSVDNATKFQKMTYAIHFELSSHG